MVMQKSQEVFLFILFKKGNLFECSELKLKLIKSDFISLEIFVISFECKTAAKNFGVLLTQKSMKRTIWEELINC
jgi:hypothetical protein